MRAPYTQLYVHVVWSTWERRALITPALREIVYGGIARQVVERRADVLAIGGTEDHVHVLIRFPTSVSIADLVGQMKGSSSHLVTHESGSSEFFKWQGGYGAFTLSKRGVPVVREYILNQEAHHRAGTLIQALERMTE